MSKPDRKRKHDKKEEVEVEVIAPKNKFKPFDEEAQAEEEKLTKILFGGASSFLQSLEEAVQERVSSTNIDSGLGETDSDDSEKDRKPAWIDEEDDGIDVGHALDKQGRRLPSGGINTRTNEYSAHLKHKFTNIVGTPAWADLNKTKQTSDDEDDEILQTCGFIKKTSIVHLPPSNLEFKKVKDLNSETYNEGPFINSVEFHPTSSVALVAGFSGVASLYAVDGKRNNKLHSISFEKYPIACGRFLKDGNEAILGSKHSFFYSYDLLAAKSRKVPLPQGLTQMKKFIISPDGKYIVAAGKWGEVHVLSSTSKERLFTLKQDSEIGALAFNPDGNLLFGHSDVGEVTVWDMNVRRVKHKWQDDGCIQGTAIDVSLSNQFIATGSSQGVVNLYNIDNVLQEKMPQPTKSIMNLTTGISNLKFNSSSEMLALSSADIENSVKLFHLASNTVFSNFPGFGAKLGSVNCLNFSPGSGYLALGNRKSAVALYRLKHFKSY